ncbi:MAG TPA: LysM domain-containing protein, partial [Candidatus Hydrogenedentes bacterium]|nr:LysM domain-containing protein [Candidatus Hydrogenedentota bacterium]
QENGASLYGDWLLEEVRRLVQEAETADAEGRKVEGAALAMLAEARGQGLALISKAKTAPVPAPAAPPPAPEKAAADTPAPAKEAEPEKKPEAKAAEAPAPGTEVTHVVASGDNPYTIAQKYGVALEDLLEWNKLTKKSRLNIGDKLVIKGASAKPAAKATSSKKRR